MRLKTTATALTDTHNFESATMIKRNHPQKRAGASGQAIVMMAVVIFMQRLFVRGLVQTEK